MQRTWYNESALLERILRLAYTTMRGCSIMITIFKKPIIYTQAEDFLNWKSKYASDIPGRRTQLYIFIRYVEKESITDITIEDIEKFKEYVCQHMTPYEKVKYMITVRGFIRFYKVKMQRLTKEINIEHL